jgi:hypothetical protein
MYLPYRLKYTKAFRDFIEIFISFMKGNLTKNGLAITYFWFVNS